MQNPLKNRLWIVEDQPEIREGMRSLLQFSGKFEEVQAFGDGEAMLEKLSATLPPNLMILDIGLPGKSGLDVLELVKSRHPQSKIVMFTVFENDQHVFEALKRGADGYLLKKETPEKILAALDDVAAGGAPMSREIARKVLETFRPVARDPRLETLTAREQEILERLAKGFLYKEIADQVGISISTVKLHLHHVYQKLQVNNRSEALLVWLNG